MSPTHLGIEVEGPRTASPMASSTTVESVSKSSFEPKERIYLGLSEDSSEGSSSITAVSKEKNGRLHLTSTDLRLGLPGSQSPERDAAVEEKPLFPLVPLKDDVCYPSPKTVVSGNKRGFSEAIDGFPGTKTSTLCERNWMFASSESDSITGTAPNQSCAPQAGDMPAKASAEGRHGSNHSKMNSSNNSSAPAAKAQVVGWPPVRSFRKNSLATTSKNNTEVDGKKSSGALFVKVSMEGAPYLRKVDLKTYTTYAEFSTSLGKMFSCFSLGKEASEFVLAYEDKDGDWMLVGDVPWEMFIESCKRLKIMKGSDAIGLTNK